MKKSLILLLFLSCWVYLIGCERKNTDHKSDQHKKNALLKSKDEKRESSTSSNVKNVSDKKHIKITEKATVTDLHKSNSGKKPNELKHLNLKLKEKEKKENETVQIPKKTVQKDHQTFSKPSEYAKTQSQVIKILQNAKSAEDAFKGFNEFFKLDNGSSPYDSSINTIISNLGEDAKSVIIGEDTQSIIKGLNYTEFDCEVRSRVIDVISTPGCLVYPASIEVKECSGKTLTNSFKKCAPGEQVDKELIVVDIDYATKAYKYRKIIVSEPIECKMECIVDASSCAPGQEFKSDSCTCACSSNDQTCIVGMQWSAITCACECSNTDSSVCQSASVSLPKRNCD